MAVWEIEKQKKGDLMYILQSPLAVQLLLLLPQTRRPSSPPRVTVAASRCPHTLPDGPAVLTSPEAAHQAGAGLGDRSTVQKRALAFFPCHLCCPQQT